MKTQFKELLHQFKVEDFKIAHGNDSVQQAARDILSFTENALNNEYHYRFHEDPDPARIETFKLIKNYTLEALLPPVLEKLVWRITVLEKQHEAMVKLLGNILETLSDDELRLDGPSA